MHAVHMYFSDVNNYKGNLNAYFT